ncbi:unnamed protein product [Schistocephalus solidus]|uniref:Reverse transcriptase domain-containing protein n=1 Tax=Schistocephalus solidus TaxID=70667 RepID=A0A183SSV8_SCHSO|nr:unnamed protein product [Schistocephalus solidus]
MKEHVTYNGAVSDAFAVINGMQQDGVIKPILFSLMIRIAYRMDGRILNQRRMHFRSHVSTATIHKLPFADECTLNATIERDMQGSMELFAAACDNFEPRINTEKTLANTTYKAAHINVNGAQLKSVDTFIYLGNILPRSTKIDDEVAHRIAKTSQAFGACRTSAGIDTVSASAPNSKCTKLSYCQRCCMERRPGRST